MKDLTCADSYFEDFQVGDRYEHVRGRTVDNYDNYFITHTTMNTAQGHFNLDYMKGILGGQFTERLVMGGATASIVIGLTSEDMSENAFLDLAITDLKLKSPVYQGDTLYATSEVLELADSIERPDAGIVRYRFTGRKADGTEVVSGIRTILVKRRAYWADRSVGAR
jgi:acyl dehydratase